MSRRLLAGLAGIAEGRLRQRLMRNTRIYYFTARVKGGQPVNEVHVKSFRKIIPGATVNKYGEKEDTRERNARGFLIH